MSERTVRYRITAEGAVPEVESLSPDAAVWYANCQHENTVDVSRMCDKDLHKCCVECGEQWTEERRR